MNKPTQEQFQPDDIVGLEVECGDESFPLLRFMVYSDYGDEINSTVRGHVLVNRVTRNKLDETFRVLTRDLSGESREVICNELEKRFGKWWFYDMHERYVFPRDMLRFVLRRGKK
jgi:hypothetical protein